MNSADILKLVNAGYTKQEIEQMKSGQDQDQNQDQNQGQDQDQNQEQDQEQGQDQDQNQEQNQEITQLRDQLTETQKQLKQLVKQMQQNNLKTASVNILPEDDLMKKTDAAMAELIRPTYEKEEK